MKNRKIKAVFTKEKITDILMDNAFNLYEENQKQMILTKNFTLDEKREAEVIDFIIKEIK